MKSLILFAALTGTLAAQPFSVLLRQLEQLPPERREALLVPYLQKMKTSPIIENDTLIHFVLYGRADSVSVIGALQHWAEPAPLAKVPMGTYSFFHRTETAPADARLDYQLVADGRYITDPQNPRITPSGFGPHSEVRMPKFVPSPYLARRDSVPAGRVMPLSLLTGVPPLLARYYVASRPMKAYLPPGYDGLTGLPVVYIVDGFEAAEWASLPTVLDNLIHEGRITPVIALFIPPSARHVEYIGARTEAFAKVLAELIVPAVDRTFRTDPSPSSRAVMGISSGGHFALYAALRRPELFGGAAGQSSTITPRLRELTRRQAAANALPAGLKLYIDVGRFDLIGEYEEGWLDFLALNRQYSALLSSLRIPHFYREVNDGHDWANWRERMPDIFIHFFGGNR